MLHANPHSSNTFDQEQQKQYPNKKMKMDHCRSQKRSVRFQEQVETVEHEPLPQHEASRLWYCRGELKAIHTEIFVSLMESKNGNLSEFEFSCRGLEEIRKRKPHKRQIRRDEYIASVIALYRKQRQVGAVVPEEIQRFAMTQSRSAKLRAQHYAALDAEEAGRVFQETFGLAPPAIAKEPRGSQSPRSRRVPFPGSVPRVHDSIARSA